MSSTESTSHTPSSRGAPETLTLDGAGDFSRLPLELFESVLYALPPLAVCALGATCSTLRRIRNDRRTWHCLLLRDYGQPHMPLPPGYSWEDAYRWCLASRGACYVNEERKVLLGLLMQGRCMHDRSFAMSATITAMRFAGKINDLEGVRILLESGLVSVNARNEQEQTLLMTAALHARKEATEYLLNRGANVNAVDERGVSAIHNAVEGQSIPVVHALLAAGAELAHYDYAGLSVIHRAAAAGDSEMVMYLARRGASATHCDHGGNSPAHILAMAGAVAAFRCALAPPFGMEHGPIMRICAQYSRRRRHFCPTFQYAQETAVAG